MQPPPVFPPGVCYFQGVLAVSDVALFHTGDAVFIRADTAQHVVLFDQSALLISGEVPFDSFVFLSGISGMVGETVNTLVQGIPPTAAVFLNPSLSAVGSTEAQLSTIVSIIKKHILYASPCPTATANDIDVQLSSDRLSATYNVDVVSSINRRHLDVLVGDMAAAEAECSPQAFCHCETQPSLASTIVAFVLLPLFLSALPRVALFSPLPPSLPSSLAPSLTYSIPLSPSPSHSLTAIGHAPPIRSQHARALTPSRFSVTCA